MVNAKPLPDDLVERYHGWKTSDYEAKREAYVRLAEEGQSPRALVISCCDSRVMVTSLFGAESGDFFMHRSIANLVPPASAGATANGTAAAIEYAVCHLKVPHVMIVGHSQCGGVRGCYDVCNGNAPVLDPATSFIGRWIDAMRPAYDAVRARGGGEAETVSALEKENVVMGLRNLMTYTFVAEAVEAGRLDLHGLWHDLHTGGLESYDADSGGFTAL